MANPVPGPNKPPIRGTFGTSGDDYSLYGTREDDTISGLGGDDEIFGYAGNDWLYGNGGKTRSMAATTTITCTAGTAMTS